MYVMFRSYKYELYMLFFFNKSIVKGDRDLSFGSIHKEKQAIPIDLQYSWHIPFPFAISNSKMTLLSNKSSIYVVIQIPISYTLVEN